MKTILLGTTNTGKLREFCDLLKPLGVSIQTPSDLGITLDIPETGETFEENAMLKAKAWAERTNYPSLVDDSGLVIDRLNGQPGVHSHRFFPGNDNDRNDRILELLANTPPNLRTARYICALAFYDPLQIITYTARGTCEGTIAFSSSGHEGFGYDPIFIPQGYSVSLGELSAEIKNSISHRRKALANILPFLQQWITL